MSLKMWGKKLCVALYEQTSHPWLTVQHLLGRSSSAWRRRLCQAPTCTSGCPGPGISLRGDSLWTSGSKMVLRWYIPLGCEVQRGAEDLTVQLDEGCLIHGVDGVLRGPVHLVGGLMWSTVTWMVSLMRAITSFCKCFMMIGVRASYDFHP